ncbi:putative chorismate pyruvate-lyase [Aeromonas caviae]|uniref:Chorismate pyruvate-lyase n=2 Tax=Aeromonas caviae TaxID=648 RepID=A0AAV4YPW9_AERCA|nr:putative chorismate pyruvate-lyase [Aeromonas caviae]GJA32888.1 putative chorismate pyruvate-lyase [Aeromonas caviae]GJA37347.1 putative chorismate pyruvate-lyase [Aeromonas caviae]GJA41847.1 putative chorismate pyruvate-lyase [Aeromonas caviae]GJA77621.1 putative chorismate pyruvate-lyase [Aeromonas caviae]
MTRRLRRYNHHLSVQLLGNRAVSLTVDEQALVAVSAPVGMCREVILHGDGGPAILGWTLFAEAALQGGGLQDLGEQPLGERIFGDAPARRDHLQLACFEIASNSWCPAATVWGRRSRLFLGQWPLLVHELFLPSLSSHSLPSDKELE